jgi:hypothetical protein
MSGNFEHNYGSLETVPGNVVRGTEEDDIIAPSGKFLWEIHALGGNDTITTGDSYDLIYAGEGDDVIHSGGGIDAIDAGGGNDTVVTEGSASVIAGDGDDHVTHLGEGSASLRGEDGDDTLLGGDGDDILQGGAGNDFVDGGAGDDVIGDGGGIDTLLGGAGNDQIFGGGQEGFVTIDAGAGDDRLHFSGGAGTALGGDGVDDLFFSYREEYYETSAAPDGSGFDYQAVEKYGGLKTFLYGGFERIAYGSGGSIPCYVRGTTILTPTGYMPVEMLQPGDAVLTASGQARPIRWIGCRAVDLRRHPAPHRVRPIRIRAGALADGVPHRDLLVSPGHAMALDGHLFRAEHLANGATILQEEWPGVEYFHVELASHDILLAEGAPAESYLDDGNRHMFGGAVTALHPVFEARQAAATCLPFAAGQAAVQPVLDRLRARAEALGWRLTDTPDLHLLADGRVLRPSLANPRLYHFHLPGGLSSLRLRSAHFRPCVMEPGSADERVLGVALRRLLLSTRGTECDVPLSHAALFAGFHPPERDGGGQWRWTDGDADLGAALLPLLPAEGARLTLYLRSSARAWAEPSRRERASLP